MFRAIRRSFTEGIRGMAKNGLMTVTSLLVVTACIFVFGVFLMCIFNINHMTTQMADDYQVDVYVSRQKEVEQNVISVFVSKDASLDEAAYQQKLDGVETLIMGTDGVDLSSIAFKSGASRIEDFEANLTQSEKDAFTAPSPDVVGDSFVLCPEAGTEAINLILALSQLEGVSDVLDSDDAYALVAGLGGISTKVSTALYDEIKASLLEEIKSLDNVDAENISFVDGVEKFKSFKEGLSAEELKDFEGLPDDLIPDAFTVKLIDLSLADDTIAALCALDHVESVENSREFVEIIDNLKDIVQKVSIWIIVAFALVSLFIISNTIKLTVHNRRKEINIMKYVGATDSYIRGPFVMEGIMIGLLSAVIAFFVSQWTYEGLMSAISQSASAMSANLGLLKFGKIWAELLGAYLLLGGVIGAFGSAISTRRYLKV